MTSLATASLGGVALLAPGMAAAAQPADTTEDITAMMGPESEYQHGLTVNGVSPTLRSVVIDGESILAYCIEYWIQAADPDHESAVTGWDEFTGDNNFKTDPQVRQHVAWILRNSHPTLPLEELATNTGVANLTEAEAIAATQSAIWHFTDDFVADGKLTVESAAHSTTAVDEQSAQNVQAVFDYFTGEANIGLNEQEVQASVTLVDATDPDTALPEAVEGFIEHEDDQVLGPISLNASTDEVDVELSSSEAEIELEALTILDADGNVVDTNQPVSTEEIWLHVPAETETGGVELAAESTEYGYTGRLITPEADDQRRFQTIVMVDQTSDQASTALELDWQNPQTEEPPEPETPPTPEEPPVEEPPVEEPPAEEPPVEEPPAEEPSVETPPAEPAVEESTPPAPVEEPEDALPEPTEDKPAEKPAQAAGELAETGAHQTRNILIALGTLMVGAALLVINRFVRKKA